MDTHENDLDNPLFFFGGGVLFDESFAKPPVQLAKMLIWQFLGSLLEINL